jgi:hypothetical protein
MKTVFLFLRQGISNRNLLRTNFLAVLKSQPEVRIVIISPIGHEAKFREEFEASNVTVEQWPRTKVGLWERRLKNLKDYIWVSRGLTQSIRVRRLAQRGRWGLAFRDLAGRVAKSVGISEEKLNDWELRSFEGDPLVRRLYDKYRPDLVVFTRVFGTNLHVIKEAKSRGIPVLCLVESWDNFICKGPLSVVPDRMAVWNPGMVTEAHELHGFPRDRVDVVGVPQFDLYTDKSLFAGRTDFFQSHGLDPSKRLITYAASTEGFIPEELDIFEMVYRAVREQDPEMTLQMMLRLHPITSAALRDEYLRRFSGRPNLVIQSPGRTSVLHDYWDPTWSDMVNLASTVHHSDIIINIASTMSIDAAVLNRPVIGIAFRVGTSAKSRYFDDVFQHSHYRKLVETNGIRLVRSVDELTEAIRDYLADPTLDAEYRNRLAEELCFQLDGHAGERAARVVLRELGANGSSLTSNAGAQPPEEHTEHAAKTYSY